MSYQDIPKDTLYAFWQYDQFPYALGGTINKMSSGGSVQTDEFGPGYFFNPLKVMPVAAGRELRAALEKLREEKRQAEKKLDDEYKKKLRKLHEEWGISFPIPK